MSNELLATSISPIFPLITEPRISVMQKPSPMLQCDHIIEKKFIQKNATGGMTWVFEVSKQAPYFGNYILSLDVAPLAPSASSTFVRWVEGFGLALLKEVRTVYASNKIFRWGKDQSYVKLRKYFCVEKEDALADAAFFDLTPAQRSVLTQAGFHLDVDLFGPVTQDIMQGIELVAMSQKPTLEIDWELPTNLLETDGAITDYANLDGNVIWNPSILYDFYHLPDIQVSQMVLNSRSKHGISTHVSDDPNTQYQVLTSLSGTGGINIPYTPQIDLFRSGAVKSISLQFIPVDCRNTPGSNAYFADQPTFNPPLINHSNGSLLAVNYIPPVDMQITASGGFAMRPVKLQYLTRYYNQYLFPSVYGSAIYEWSWALDPVTPNQISGKLTFQNLDQPQLVITFPNGTGIYPPGHPKAGQAQQLYAVITYYRHNFTQLQGGDYLRVFQQ